MDVHDPDVCETIAEIMRPFVDRDRDANIDNTRQDFI